MRDFKVSKDPEETVEALFESYGNAPKVSFSPEELVAFLKAYTAAETAPPAPMGATEAPRRGRGRA